MFSISALKINHSATPDASRVGEILRDFLLTQQIVTGESTKESALNGFGYRPGPSALSVCQNGEAASFLQLWTNGVMVQIGRQIFHSFCADEYFATCGKCRDRFNMFDQEPAIQALGDF